MMTRVHFTVAALKPVVLAATLMTAGIATAEAAQFHVIQLSYKNGWDRTFDVHFAPPGGFGKNDCQQSLQQAIDEYGPDLNRAFKKNFGSEVGSFNRAVFVEGKCEAFDRPPGQTFNLKISGE